MKRSSPLRVLLLLAAAACSASPEERAVSAAWADRFLLFAQPPEPRDTLTPPPVEDGRYAVDVGVSPTLAAGPAPFYHAHVTALGLNGVAARPRELCLVGARLWPEGRGIAGPAVWSSIGRGDQCASADRPGSVAGGVPHQVSAAEILGASMAEGGYLPVVRVRADGRVVDLPGQRVWVTPVRDTAPPVADLALLRYRGTTAVRGTAPPVLSTTVHLSVAGERAVRAEGGGCALTLLAYRTPGRTGAPAWDSRRRDVVCGMGLVEFIIGRGRPRDRLRQEIPVDEVLGDSLPEGRYYFTARVAWPHAPPLEGEAAQPETVVELPAGEAFLTKQLPPLATRAVAGPLTLHARTDAVAGRPGTFLAALTVTNHTDGAVYLGAEMRPLCAGFAAFRSAGDRDRSRSKPWSPGAWEARGCMIPIRDQWVPAGHSRTFGGRFTARTVLGDTLPPGRYFFSITFAPGLPERRAVLAAGDASLR